MCSSDLGGTQFRAQRRIDGSRRIEHQFNIARFNVQSRTGGGFHAPKGEMVRWCSDRIGSLLGIQVKILAVWSAVLGHAFKPAAGDRARFISIDAGIQAAGDSRGKTFNGRLQVGMIVPAAGPTPATVTDRWLEGIDRGESRLVAESANLGTYDQGRTSSGLWDADLGVGCREIDAGRLALANNRKKQTSLARNS